MCSTIGTGLLVIRAIRNDHNLVGSLDVSTPETAASNGRIPDKTWTQHKLSVFLPSQLISFGRYITKMYMMNNIKILIWYKFLSM